MIDNMRLFPRYSVTQLKATLSLEVYDSHIIDVKNLSLSGLQLSCSKKVIFKGLQEAELKILNKRPYKIQINQAWYQNDLELNEFVSGFKIQFSKKEDYQSWIQLIKALHLVKQKQKT